LILEPRDSALLHPGLIQCRPPDWIGFCQPISPARSALPSRRL